jgi:hypothetical protein
MACYRESFALQWRIVIVSYVSSGFMYAVCESRHWTSVSSHLKAHTSVINCRSQWVHFPPGYSSTVLADGPEVFCFI